MKTIVQSSPLKKHMIHFPRHPSAWGTWVLSPGRGWPHALSAAGQDCVCWCLLPSGPTGDRNHLHELQLLSGHRTQLPVASPFCAPRQVLGHMLFLGIRAHSSWTDFKNLFSRDTGMQFQKAKTSQCRLSMWAGLFSAHQCLHQMCARVLPHHP